MKKLATALLTILMVFTFIACDTSDTNSRSSRHSNKTDGRSAAECYKSVMRSKSAKEMASYVHTEDIDIDEYFSKVNNFLGDDNYTVDIEAAGHYGDYNVFYVTISSINDSSKTISGFECFLKKGDDYYLVAFSDERTNKINLECVCPTCAGSGDVTSGQIVCSICAGTGVQTIQNAYYDPTLNMWMPQTIGCGGCGGSGYTVAGSVKTCNTCKGRRYVFDK